MEFTASTVNWDLVCRLKEENGLEDALLECEPNPEIGQTPWPNNSAHQHMIVAEELEKHCSNNEIVSAIQNNLINEDFGLPQDLGDDLNPELVAGAINPDNAKSTLKLFDSLDFSLFNSDTKEYLQQWKNMLIYSTEKNGGILFHLG